MHIHMSVDMQLEMSQSRGGYFGFYKELLTNFLLLIVDLIKITELSCKRTGLEYGALLST